MPTVDSKILDHRGEPIKKQTLFKPVATPSVQGVTNRWFTDSLANGLTPRKLATAIKSANEGDDYDLLTLAEEMEERDLHYYSLLSTRKLAVEGLPIKVDPATHDSAKAYAEADADFIESLTLKPEFEEMLSDLLDGIAKGRSTVETIFSTGDQFLPTSYKWWDPRLFKYYPESENPSELRIIDEGNEFGKQMNPAQFITHIPKLKNGLVTRSGLARINAVAYMCKSFNQSDWMAYAELLGVPMRIGKYGQNTSEPDKDILRLAVASLGSDAAAILPDSMQIELVQKAAASGDGIFLHLAEHLEKQQAKAILGQTSSSDSVAGQLGGDEEKSEVRQDRVIADSKQLARTLNKQWVKILIDLNFGVREHYPRLFFFIEEPEDTKQTVDSATALFPFGFEVDAQEMASKLGLSLPEGAPKILKQAPASGGDENPENKDNTKKPPPAKTALNREEKKSDLDALIEESIKSDWQELMQPMIDPIQQLSDESETPEEFEAGLSALLDKMDETALAQSLSTQIFKARGLGDTQ